MDIGSAVGRRQGVTEQQLLDLAAFETSSAFTELELSVKSGITAIISVILKGALTPEGRTKV